MKIKDIITESISIRDQKKDFRNKFILEVIGWGDQTKKDATISKFKRFSPKQIISWALVAGLSIGSLSYIVSDAETELQIIRTMNRLMMTEPQKAKEYVDWINKRLAEELMFEDGNAHEHVTSLIKNINGIVAWSNVEEMESIGTLAISFESENREGIVDGEGIEIEGGHFKGKYTSNDKYVRLISGKLHFGGMKVFSTLEASWNSQGKINGRFEYVETFLSDNSLDSYIIVGNANDGIVDDSNIVIQTQESDQNSTKTRFHYHGGFKNGHLNGPGRLTLITARNTTITVEGNWKNGKLESVTNLVSNDKIFRPSPQDSELEFAHHADGEKFSPYTFFGQANKWNVKTSSFHDGKKTPPIYTKASDDIPPSPDPIENPIQRQNLTNKK